MNNGNWFAVSRLIFEHYVVGAGQPVPPRDPKKGAYSKMEAWLWLVANAAYEPRKVVNKGREMELQPGQLMGAYSYLAEQWNWTPETVRWFLKRLETCAMITRWAHTQRTNRNTNQTQVLSVCNYGQYQITKESEHQPGQQATPQADTKPATSQQHESNNKQVTLIPPQPPQGGIPDPITVAFEEWWEAYPACSRKVAKGECLALFRQVITGSRRPNKRRQKILDHGRATAEELIAAVRRYAASKPDPEFVPAPATWLNQGRWLDDSQPANGEQRKYWWQDQAKLREMTPERWKKGISQHANGMWPIDKLGFPPGHPMSVVPAEVIDEMQLWDEYDERGMRRS